MNKISKVTGALGIALTLGGLAASTYAQTPPTQTHSSVSVAASQKRLIPVKGQASTQTQSSPETKILLAQSGISLPRGIWSFNGNSYLGQLNITAVDSQGNLTGTVYGQKIIGFWDEASQKITFIRVINPSDPSTYQIYTGFLFQMPGRTDPLYYMTGYFEAFSGTGATAKRVLYGWYAQIRILG